MRLDLYLTETFPEHSRSTWQKRIKQGDVTINATRVLSPKHEVTGEEKIAIAELRQPEQTVAIPILYEDDNVIVIDKPVGVLTHAKGALHEEMTVADFFRPKTTFGLETNRPGIVHRLDRDTSGVMIGAKNPETARLLSKQFQDRKAKKTYTAVLDGIPKAPKANIDLPIERNPKAPSTFRVGVGGKSAQTYYEVLEASNKRALVMLAPTTGRTHQLRVHMAYLGTPIVGDRVYGNPSDRLYLHATTLEITIPSGQRQTFASVVPNGFREQLL